MQTYFIWSFFVSLITLGGTFLVLRFQYKKDNATTSTQREKSRTRNAFVIGSILIFVTFAGSLVTLLREIADKEKGELEKQEQYKKSLRIERRRLKEYQILLDRNNSLLLNMRSSMSTANRILQTQNLALMKQSELVDRQISFGNNLIGADGNPKLIVKVSDIESISTYKIEIAVTNVQDYPYHNVHAYLGEWEDDDEFLKVVEQPFDSIAIWADRREGEYKSIPVGILGPKTTKLVSTKYWKISEKSNRFRVQLDWSTGSCQIYFFITSRDYKPVIYGTRVTQIRPKVDLKEGSELKRYFEVMNWVTDDTIDSLKARLVQFKELDIRKKLHLNSKP